MDLFSDRLKWLQTLMLKGQSIKCILFRKTEMSRRCLSYLQQFLMMRAEREQTVKTDFYFTEQKSSLYTAVRIERDGKEVMGVDLKVVE